MERTLAAFASSDAPLAARLRVAREVARAVAALHARGGTHGALCPEAVVVPDGGAAVLAAPPPSRPLLAGAGFDAPEVARGGRATRRSDAFSLGALAGLALSGRAPFHAEDPVERVRRVLHDPAQPVRLRAPGVPLEVDGAIAALLEKRPRRRAGAADLLRALEAAEREGAEPAAAGIAPLSPLSEESEREWASLPSGPPASLAPAAAKTPPLPPLRGERERERGAATPAAALPAPRARARTEPTPLAAASPAPPCAPAIPAAARWSRTWSTAPLAVAREARRLRRAAANARRTLRALPLPLPSAARRAALLAAPLAALLLLLLRGGDGALEREIAELVARGELAAARGRLEEAARAAPGDPLVEKLRGDVACARGAAGECLRRYRVALAARPAFREDPALRANARRLLARDHACGTRRAAANLLGELRDPESLPALEAARRSAGILAVFCTGDSIDRAITATRADLGPRRD